MIFNKNELIKAVSDVKILVENQIDFHFETCAWFMGDPLFEPVDIELYVLFGTRNDRIELAGYVLVSETHGCIMGFNEKKELVASYKVE